MKKFILGYERYSQKCPRQLLRKCSSKTLQRAITQMVYADEPRYFPGVPLSNWAYASVYAGEILLCEIMPGKYSEIESYTEISCMWFWWNFLLVIWYYREYSICMCIFVLKSIARNMKKISTTVYYNSYLYLRAVHFYTNLHVQKEWSPQ